MPEYLFKLKHGFKTRIHYLSNCTRTVCFYIHFMAYASSNYSDNNRHIVLIMWKKYINIIKWLFFEYKYIKENCLNIFFSRTTMH